MSQTVRPLTQTESDTIEYRHGIPPSEIKALQFDIDGFVGVILLSVDAPDSELLELTWNHFMGQPNFDKTYTNKYRVVEITSKFPPAAPHPVVEEPPLELYQPPVGVIPVIPPDPYEPPLPPPPIRISSLANPPNTPSPLYPTMELIRPFLDPEGTFRATRVEEMFSFGSSLPSTDVVYEVGLPLNIGKSFVEGILVVRNNTVNTALKVVMILPSYLKTESSLEFTVAPDVKAGIRVMANLTEAKQLSIPLTSLFHADAISISVLPINVISPVYVRSVLLPLTT